MNGLTLMEWLNDVDDRYKKEADIFYRKAPGQPRPLRRALQVLGYAAGVAAAIAVTVGLLWLGQLQKPPTGPVHAAASSVPSPEPTKAPSAAPTAAPSPAPSKEPSSSVSVPSLTAEELKDGSAAITEDQGLPSTLTVYRSRFVPGVTESTESLQNALKEEAEAFVSSLGVEEGELTKDFGRIEDKYNPTVLYSTNHFRLRAMPVGITVAYDIKNAFDIALNRPEDLLQDDYVAAALRYLGITDPYLTVQENRSVQGEVISATIRIRPKPENCADAAFLNAFSCVALTIQQDLDSVVLTVRDPANFRVDHEAETVPYSEAMTSFLAENSSIREADIECVLEYSDSGSNGIFLPYYRIRENREGETVQEVRVLAVDEERSAYKGEETPAPASIPTPTPAPEEPAELDPEILTQGAAALVTQYLEGRYESENTRVPLAELYAENVHVYQSNRDMDAIAVGFRVVLRPENPDDWEKLMVGNAKPGTGDKEGCVTQGMTLYGRRGPAGWTLPDNAISGGIIDLVWGAGEPEDQVVKSEWPLEGEIRIQ